MGSAKSVGGVARLLTAMSMVLVVIGVGCKGEQDPTAIVVEVYSDIPVPNDLNRVEVVVFDRNQMEVLRQDFDLRPGGRSLPGRLGLEPQDDGLGPITVQATGYQGARALVSRRATLSFQRNRMVLLQLGLLSRCQSISCPDGQTCDESLACVDEKISRKLPFYAPGQPGPEVTPPVDAGGGMPPRRDGAVDGPAPQTDGPVSDRPAVDALSPDGPVVPPPPPPDGAPPRSENGVACTNNTQCVSGACVDGVCCASACTGACQACTMAKTGKPNGTCAAVTANTDPDDDCNAEPANTCGNDGMCDGAGACRKHGTNVSCAAASCSGATFTPARTCDGKGACQAASPSDCGVYLCNASGCRSSCADDGDCVAPQKCINNKCGGKRATGEACGGAGECSSGFCVDGVCCGSACDGACEACVMAKTGQPNGMCQPVSDGQDPDNECAPAAASSCGNDGMCNGARACRKYGGSTMCSSATCSGTTFVPPRFCNGSGGCVGAANQACGAYACGASGCKTGCQQESDCSAGNYCGGGVCQPKKANGGACTVAGECASGSCRDGVCCNEACTGACKKCSATGVCGAVASADDPDTCTGNNTCDGAGACKLKVGQICSATTDCANGNCRDTRCCASACNGVCQTCNTGSAGTCGMVRYNVDPDSCTTNDFCDGAGACVPGIILNRSYFYDPIPVTSYMFPLSKTGWTCYASASMRVSRAFGTVPAVINVNVVDPSGQFFVAGNQSNTCNATVAPGNFCDFSVCYAPKTVGTHTATLEAYDGTGRKVQMALTGTADQ